MGYTREENPDREAGLLALPLGQLIGGLSWSVTAETYSVADALKCVAEAMKTVRKCPRRIMFDEITVIQTLQRELKDVIDVIYYAPASAEETEMATQIGRMPGFQGLQMFPNKKT